MSIISKVLLRKDAASVAVAVIVGFSSLQLLTGLSNPLVNKLSPEGDQYTAAAADFYMPVIAFAAQVLLLELLLAVVIFARGLNTTPAKSSKKKK